MAAWLTVLAAWTVLLVLPGSVFPPPPQLTPRLSAGKVLHVTAYAMLAGAVGWLGVSDGGRWRLIALLLLHGALTEQVQSFVPRREGSLVDVGLNHAGVVIGAAVAGRAWPRSGTAAYPPDAMNL